jgi:4-amino-4-deoxy-L-arabinose transferase-like glycosyltransferase
LYGFLAGYLALFFYCFSPNLLAHSRLATLDFGATCFIFLASYFFWQTLTSFSYSRLIGAGILFGLAQISKFTSLYLVPVYAFLTLLLLLKKELAFKRFIIIFGVILGMGILIINLAYLFKSPSFFSPGTIFSQSFSKVPVQSKWSGLLSFRPHFNQWVLILFFSRFLNQNSLAASIFAFSAIFSKEG